MTELPTSFGKYFLTEKLAAGGMAEIYLAKLVGPGGFEKQLVIKQIHPRLTGQRHFVDLFVAEAKTLVTLAHGNIVPVYELGVVGDRYFIAMDYIDGPTLYRLTEMLAKRDVLMVPAVAAWIAARILEGLDYAHRKGEGVIHRDLSPRNVMLSRDGEVKIVDFGIAITHGTIDSTTDEQSAPTGSFPYMSPEQVRREPLTGASDLFSVGVLLWEMLAGERLFARPDARATLDAVVDADIPRPSARRPAHDPSAPAIPPRLEDVVMRAVERDLTARWRSAADMLAALNKYLYALDETPGPRDLAALVARFCPPETRRMPTHSELVPTAAAAALLDDDAPAAPSTAVMSPSTAVVPRGKQRVRTETFATHASLAELLDHTQPHVPTARTGSPDPSADISSPIVTPSAVADPAPSESSSGTRAADAAEREIPEAGPLKIVIPDAVRKPPSTGVLFVVALGTIALGIAAVVFFLKNRDRVLGAEHDAAIAVVGSIDAPAVEPPPVDAAIATPPIVIDAAPIVDAAVRVDAGVVVHVARVDAGGVRVDAAASVAGEATLKVGADPWGEIVIDGTPRGRTPAELVVPAGKHTVVVIFRGVEPPVEKAFTVDLSTGEVETLHADFR